MGGKLEHILWYVHIRDVIEIVRLVTHFVWVSQGDSKQSLTACFKRNDVRDAAGRSQEGFKYARPSLTPRPLRHENVTDLSTSY
jgi:hypothetical protein